MNRKKDWIIENIHSFMKDKGMKLDTISSTIGISHGEFSKILKGEREQYYKHLPQIAHVLGVTYHDLVKQNTSTIQDNLRYEDESALHNGIAPNYAHQLVNQCQHTIDALKSTIATLNSLVKNEKEAKENFKRKYEKMKARVEELEKGSS
jgi:transcriptional regulator with XRE-family HTH domain